jgi:ABC-2 type transport system permease protein
VTPSPSYRSPAWRDIALVYAREVEARMRTKTYAIGLLVAMVIMAVMVVIVTPGAPKTYTVAACGASAASFGPPGPDTRVRQCSGFANAAAQVGSGRVDAAVVVVHGRGRVLVRSATAAPATQAAQSMAQHWALIAALRSQHVNLPQLNRDTAATMPGTVTVGDRTRPYDNHDLGAAIVMVVVLFAQIFGQGAAIAGGVVEEKSTRIVEVLLSTLTPLRLMAGKVAGIGTAALVQVFAMAAALAVTEKVRGGHVTVLPGTAVLATGLGWFILTFALFAFLFAAAGSMVSRPEELQSVITPVLLLAMAPLGVALVAVNSVTAPWVNAVRYIPPFSGLLMPLQAAVHVVTPQQQLIAAGLMVLGTAGCAWLGARIYQNSVLRIGATVRWRQALSAA